MHAPLVLLTRAAEDNAPLAALLEAAGFRPESYPCVALSPEPPPPEDVAHIRAGGPIHGIAFPSKRAVEGLRAATDARRTLGLDGEARLVVGAVGATTAQAARRSGWPEVLVPPQPLGAALADTLAAHLPRGARVLIPCGDRTRPELPDGLARHGLVPLPLTVYRHRAVQPAPVSARPAVAVVASPSAARTLLTANPGGRAWAFVAIGPTTARALADLGARDVTVAPSPRTEGLLEAVRARLARRPQDPTARRADALDSPPAPGAGQSEDQTPSNPSSPPSEEEHAP